MKRFSLEHVLPLRQRSRFLAFCLLVFMLLIIALVVSTLTGSVTINAAVIGKIIINKLVRSDIFEPTWGKNIESIVWTLRLPRIILAFAVGAGLSLCGLLMQALTKNSLADPYVLGISSGASAGAVCSILFGWFAFAGQYHVMFGATAGAFLALIIAMKAATINNRITSTQLVLSGIAVSAMFSSFTNICIYHSKTGSDKVNTALYWMLGSLGGASWEKMFYGLIAFTLCTVVISFFHQSLDVLMLGDDTAATLGVDLKKMKTGIIVLATILTGIIVSISGVIGFVGLVIPHITRSIVGSTHRRLIPAAILVGGLFVIICDVISRTIASPQELSIGVVTSFFGAPFFLFLIRKSKNTFGGRL